MLMKTLHATFRALADSEIPGTHGQRWRTVVSESTLAGQYARWWWDAGEDGSVELVSGRTRAILHVGYGGPQCRGMHWLSTGLFRKAALPCIG